MLPNDESSEIYADKQELLDLNNAVHGTNYDNPEELEINTLENAIYLSMRNDKLLKACKSLRDYVEYVSRVRQYAEAMVIEDAVERAITECIKEGILADFLTRCRSEAKKMSIYEYDEEKQRELDRRDWMADGIEVGKKAGEERLVKLYRYLTKENKLEDFPYIMESKEYREKMFVKYNL